MTNEEIIINLTKNIPTLAMAGDYINLRQFYYLAISKGFKATSLKAFDKYLNENIVRFNLITKLNSKKARTLGNAIAVIDKFKSSEVAFANAVDNDYVFRTKLGNGDVVLYNYEKLTKSEVNALKAAYAKIEGVKYYDARPCLFKNWKTWSDERQQASCKDNLEFVF